MSELMDLRVPGLGLAPAMVLPHENLRARDALLRDRLYREDLADQRPAGGVRSGVVRLLQALRRRPRVASGRLAVSKGQGSGRPSRRTARA